MPSPGAANDPLPLPRLLMFCWPLCFIGLFIKEDRLVCPDCGARRDF